MSTERGTVIRWFTDRGFGFIRPETPGDADLFLHVKNLVGVQNVVQGDAVTFSRAPDRRNPGRWEAVRVEVV